MAPNSTSTPVEMYQLWMLYARDPAKGDRGAGWYMEGFFPSPEEATARYRELWEDPETPCIEDSRTVVVAVLK